MTALETPNTARAGTPAPDPGTGCPFCGKPMFAKWTQEVTGTDQEVFMRRKSALTGGLEVATFLDRPMRIKFVWTAEFKCTNPACGATGTAA